jgi:hypothetical protein
MEFQRYRGGGGGGGGREGGGGGEESTAETHTSFDMSRKSKSKYQTKALNIPFTLTQGDLLQEALAVTFAKDQTQALNISVKVPPRRWIWCVVLQGWYF